MLEVITMGKALSLTFAICAVIFFIGIGISLSYQQLWLAILLALLSVLFIGAGFILKAKLRR